MTSIRDIDFDHACMCRRLSLAGWRTWGRVVSCYDGDTVTVVIDTPFSSTRGQNTTQLKFACRLSGINTPEIRSENKEAALAARDFLIGLVVGKKFDKPLAGGDIRVELMNAGCIWVECGGFDKYGRLLGVLRSDPSSSTTFNGELINAGHAVAYVK